MRAVFEVVGMQDVVVEIPRLVEPVQPRPRHLRRAQERGQPASVAARRGLKVSTLQARRRDAGSEAAERWRGSGGDRDHGKKPAASAKNITVEQIGSPIRREFKQRDTLIGLKLNKLHRTSTLEDTPAVRGMIEKVKHLVRVVDGQ